jgi:hypothetical protein
LHQELTCGEIAGAALIERYLAGRLSDREAEALESHFLLCDRCQTEIRLAVAIRDGLAVQDPLRRGRSPELVHPEIDSASVASRARTWSRRRPLRWVVPAAAAAALAGLLILEPKLIEREAPPVHREEIPEHAAPTALHPVGAVSAVDEFRWSAVPGADLYRVTVYDTTGTVLLEAETADVRLRPPEEADLGSGVGYLWTVAARVGLTRWVRSGMAQFHLAQP